MHSKRTSFNRRQFFARSAVAAGATTLGGGLFDALVARSAYAGEPQGRAGGGYGPLRPAGEDLALPVGFQYRVISNEGDPMDDGFPTPKAMDGMAAFAGPNGNIVLVRNHEDGQAGNTLRPRPPGSTSTSAGILADRLETHYGPRAFAYDEFAAGGTTTLIVEPHGQRRLVGQHWSLVGTVRNCAGGLTPWGSWISSEETLENASATNYAEDHGYNFEVPIDTECGTPAQPVPLRHLGRFAHEAVAVDPATGAVYETEDQGDGSGFYRFMPSRRPQRPGDLAVTTGMLQMLKVVGMPQYETAINQTVGVPLPVEWVNITNPDPTPVSVVVSGATLSAVFVEGLAAGGARFRRLEGCWYDRRKIYFISTNGGNMGFGQVWMYRHRRPDDHAGGRVLRPRHVRWSRQLLRQPSRRRGVLRGRDGGPARPRRLARRRGLRSRAQPAQLDRIRRRVFQPGRQHAVRQSLRARQRADDAAVSEPGADSGRSGEVRTLRDGRDLGPVEVGSPVITTENLGRAADRRPPPFHRTRRMA